METESKVKQIFLNSRIRSVFSIRETKELRFLPWLRIVLHDGRKIELYPIEKTLEGERYPSLGIEAQEVNDFESVFKWPGGPALEWEEIGELKNVLGEAITGVETSDPLEQGIDSAILLHFENGIKLTVAHSTSPMGLDIEIYEV